MIDVSIPDISFHQTNRKPAQPGGLVQVSTDEDGPPIHTINVIDSINSIIQMFDNVVGRIRSKLCLLTQQNLTREGHPEGTARKRALSGQKPWFPTK